MERERERERERETDRKRERVHTDTRSSVYEVYFVILRRRTQIP